MQGDKVNMRINDKVAVITGGAQGIGAAVAARLVQDGAAFLTVLDINEKVSNTFLKL